MSEVISLQKLQQEIHEICHRCGRRDASVKVLAVSKLQPVDKIKKLQGLGQVHFGENYVQELLSKETELGDLKISWHLIGHLQKNKVRQIIGHCELIHSVDSLELAQEISKRAITAGTVQKILLQVNVAGENSKEGFDIENLFKELKNILELPQVEVLGLMTMPPFVENSEENRPFFRRLRELLDRIRSEFPVSSQFAELSMGTSQDFAVAIEEGATWIRLGSTLFGERLKKK